jgi:6-phosphogluconolactonase
MFRYHAGFAACRYHCSSFVAFKFSEESRMLQKALVLAFVVASIAGCVSCGNTANHYVYASLPAANQIIAYREDPNSGVLTQIAGSPYAVGDGVHSLVLHPSGKYLYAANPGQNENDVSQFTIASDGVLTEVFPRASVASNGMGQPAGGSLPEILVMDPAGNYLYVANAGSNNISVFSIDSSTGVLTQLANSPFTIGLPPLNMALTPSGSFLFVSGSGSQTGLIAGFSVNAGVLQLVSESSSFGTIPNGLAIDPSGSYLYVTNTGSNAISAFTIGSSGALTEISGSPLSNTTYAYPITLILDPTGSYLYVANQGSSNVSVYSVTSSTGLPVPLTSSTSTFAFNTEKSPSFLVEDPSGKYLYVGNQGSPSGIQAFGLNGGNLNPLYTYDVGNTPTSIAVLQ